MKSRIVVRNARQHNLKGVDLDLPRRKLVVLTGPSGSGKSSLAFDTIYAEGQRRYVESLSSYAKQFLDRMEKPAVDRVDGISPAVAIEQKNPTKTSRSTVGTATEVHDYLRLLWARVGRTYCPECGREVRPDTVQSATDAVLALEPDTRFMVCFPLPRSARADHATIVENLRALGFQRVLVEGETFRLDEPDAEDADALGTDLTAPEELLVIVDRLAVPASDDDAARETLRARLADSVSTAFAEGDGEAVVVGREGAALLRFTERFRCPDHPDVAFLDPTPRLFSFNNPYGSCPECTGFGAVLEYDEALMVPDETLSLKLGALDPWSKPRYKKERRKLLDFAKESGIDPRVPWRDLPEDFRRAVIHGTKGKGKGASFRGLMRFMKSREKKRYKQYIRVFLRQYQSARECPACRGRRLRPEALYVRVGGIDVAAAASLSITALRDWMDALDLSEHDAAIAASILREIRSRLRFLDDVGLGYLTLDRQTRTLSGGESQRISLANSLGSSLVDTLYVLDEPTIGLHPRDNDRLLDLLRQLRDGGNSVLVVEHDPAAIAAADHVVELGPHSGERGGTIVFEGTYQELLESGTSTGDYLGEGGAAPAREKRDVDGASIRLEGATLHNLKSIDVEIPLNALTVVTGVSGSGKSTLVHDVLYRALERKLVGATSAKRHLGEAVGSWTVLEGLGRVDAVVLVDQSPIGRTPRSNPVTYIKAFDRIRDVFASQPLSKQRGYKPGTFSFNVKGGRCEACKGDGVVQVEMVFMADVYVPCDICGGARYKSEVLEVEYKGKNIREVLDLTIDEAIRFFIKEDRLGRMLWQLQQVGLGYLRLGQPAPTLSGGEAQRMKIARELVSAGKKRGHRIYILDEPTTGLSGPEAIKLIEVLDRLLDAGHTVIVIEHNLEVIRAADWIIDLGPEAGPGGGQVVAMGTPDDVAAVEASHTGRYLRAEVAGRRS